MTKTTPLEIKLLGQKIVLKTTESNPELAKEIVNLVSSKIKEAESRVKSPAPHQVVLIALLDLAEEYVKAKRKTLDFKREMNEKSSHLLSLLDPESK